MNGTLTGGETFAWGFWLDAPQVGQTATQAAADDLATIWTAGPANELRDLITPDCSYTSLNVYSYNTADTAATWVGETTLGPVVGTGLDPALPLQCAAVVTLRTDSAGRQNRGRMYLPVTSAALSDHQLTDPDVDAFLDAIQLWFSSINARVAVAGSVCVVSSVGSHTTVVTAVSADSRLDIQRRRAAGEVIQYRKTAAV